MKYVFAVLITITLLTASAVGADWEPAALESFFDGMMAVQLRQYKSPGAVVAVVKDGQVLLLKGYGWADQEAGRTVDEQTLFRPGSVSKLFVWVAVMQLVEDGLLDLDEDIQQYLDFPLPTVLLSGAEAPPITLRHLMTHRAGFEDVVTEVFVAAAEQIQPLSDYVRSVPARVFAPGEVGLYSNYGSSLAAYIVERVSGRLFYEYVEEAIFAPLAMDLSSFRQPLPAELTPLMSKGYVLSAGLPQAGAFEWVQSYPAGGLSSSAQDMARFMLALLPEPELNRAGDPAALQPPEIWEPPFPELQISAPLDRGSFFQDLQYQPAEPWQFSVELQLPAFPGWEALLETLADEDDGIEVRQPDVDAAEIPPEAALLQPATLKAMYSRQAGDDPRVPGMTLGFIESEINGFRLLSHGGDTPQMHAGLWLLLEENLGLYVAYNGAGAGLARITIIEEFMDRYFPARRPPDPGRALKPEEAAVYVGLYQPLRANYSSIEKLLQLFQTTAVRVNSSGYLTLPIAGTLREFAKVEPGLFRSRDDRFVMAAVYDDQGSVVGLSTGGPFSLQRAPWYARPNFLIALAAVVVIWFGAFVTAGALKLRRPAGRRGLRDRWYLWLPGLVFALAVAVLFTGGIRAVLDVHPDYAVPTLALRRPAGLYVLGAAAGWISAAAALWLSAAAVYLLFRRGWGFWKRVYYVLSTIVALSFVWILWFIRLLSW